MSTPRASRRVGLFAALGLLGALLLFFRWGSSGGATAPEAEPAASAAAATAAAPPSGSGPSLALGITAAAGTRPKPSLPDGGLARTAADDYRRRARYPRSSYPIATVDDDPVARERVVHPVSSRGQGNEEPTLTVYPALVGFESPDPALVYAFLAMGERKIEARSMTATVITHEGNQVGQLVYRDDGTAGDAVADDHVYTAVFLPGAEAADRPATSYMVRVTATTRGDEQRMAVTSFLYSFPDAQLTGAYRDAVVDGSLQLQAEVLVTAAGRFHLEAALYDWSGEVPLAWAQTAQELPAGRHWMTVPFYGLILQERGVDGPYLVRNVALSTASAMPNAKNRLADRVHMTAAYAASRFTDAPYDDRELLDAADRVERDTGNLGGLEAGG